MTAQAYLNVGTRAQSAGAATLTPALPGSRVAGNTLLAVCVSKNNATHSTATAGWVKKDQVLASSFTASLWECEVDGTEAAPVFTWTGSVACSASVWQYTRDDEATALTGAISSNFGTGTTHTSPALTTTAANSRIAYIDVCGANTAVATPTSRTERFDAGSATGATRHAVGDSLVTTAGSSSGAISIVAGNAAWIQWQVELLEPVFAGSTFLISADGNDGTGDGGSFITNELTQGDDTFGTFRDAGWRFLSITIPQGATIVSARLIPRAYTGLSPSGTTWGNLYGQLVANAPAWSGGSLPNSGTKTTASTPMQTSGVDGALLPHNVTAQVQQIVNQATWASGNAMRFFGDHAGADGFTRYYDYSQDPAKAAQLLIEYTTGGGGSTLSPSLVANAQTFFGPTVTRGAVTLTPSLLTNAQSFYAATLTASYTIAPPQIPSATAFYSPTVQPGAVTLAPALLANSQTFYAPTVQADAVLAPSLLTNSQIFPAQTVTTSYSLTAPLLTNTSSLFAPIVSTGAVIIVPPLLSDGDTFFAPTVTPATVSLSAPLLTNPQTVFGPVVTSDGSLSPPLLANSQAFFAASITTGSVQISPPLISDGEVFFGGAVMVGLVEIKPGLHTNEQAFFGPTVSVGSVDLAPPLVANDNHFYAAEIYNEPPQMLEPALVVSENVIFAASVFQSSDKPLPFNGTARNVSTTMDRSAETRALSRNATSTRPRDAATAGTSRNVASVRMRR